MVEVKVSEARDGMFYVESHVTINGKRKPLHKIMTFKNKDIANREFIYVKYMFIRDQLDKLCIDLAYKDHHLLDHQTAHKLRMWHTKMYKGLKNLFDDMQRFSKNLMHYTTANVGLLSVSHPQYAEIKSRWIALHKLASEVNQSIENYLKKYPIEKELN